MGDAHGAERTEEQRLAQRLFGGAGVTRKRENEDTLQEAEDQDVRPPPTHWQLFALDVDVDVPSSTDAPTATAASDQSYAAWVDADDEQIMVPLVGAGARAPDGSMRGVKKLRKLRSNPSEQVISGAEYQRRLRRQYERMHPRPAWASVAPSTGESSAWSAPLLSDLLSAESGLASRGVTRRLTPDRLDVERLRDANEAQERAEEPAAIEHIAFHPSARSHVLLTASRDRRVRLFQINGSTNPLLETLHVPDLPIKTAQFHPSGHSVLIAGNRPYLYAYDIRSGKTIRSSPWRGAGKMVSSAGGAEVDAGTERDLSFVRFEPGAEARLVAIVDWGAGGVTANGGGQRIGELRMNAPIAGMTWAPSTSTPRLLTLSTEGRVHVWDVRNRACPVMAFDPGLFGAKGLECASSSLVPSAWAVGSASGVVNVYGGADDRITTSATLDGLVDTPVTAPVTDDVQLKPRRALGNLTTAITSMQFSHDAQLLAIASRNKKDALRMVHVPTLQTYSNWPTAGTPLGHVTALDFSTESRYMAIGNSRGRVLLYALRSYVS
ncbi:U3 snoRNP protein [Malassezia brasiliensis]|uniref:U3 snoRNP protein n=1 Tax=Malassezia brasiliensis TaxID=1821822 RepID=A0AAF0IMJ6_9BASI|nr:U3 snoRNP protein [Malassezia brasiliensis]